MLVKPTKGRGSWGIPKGHTNPGESIEDCAHREVDEEAGIAVELGTKLPVVSTTSRNEFKHVHSFLARQVGSNRAYVNDPDGLTEEVKWFDVDALPDIHPYQQPLIKIAVEMLRVTLERREQAPEQPT